MIIYAVLDHVPYSHFNTTFHTNYVKYFQAYLLKNFLKLVSFYKLLFFLDDWICFSAQYCYCHPFVKNNFHAKFNLKVTIHIRICRKLWCITNNIFANLKIFSIRWQNAFNELYVIWVLDIMTLLKVTLWHFFVCHNILGHYNIGHYYILLKFDRIYLYQAFMLFMYYIDYKS